MVIVCVCDYSLILFLWVDEWWCIDCQRIRKSHFKKNLSYQELVVNANARQLCTVCGMLYIITVFHVFLFEQHLNNRHVNNLRWPRSREVAMYTSEIDGRSK